MSINSITSRTVRIPVDKPTRIATRYLSHPEYIIVEIADSEHEAVGVGYAYAGTVGGEMMSSIVNNVFAPRVIGRDGHRVAAIWEELYQECLLIGRRGAVIKALSALDIALWDLKSKIAGLPLSVLLGGSLDPVPAYASGGYYRPDDGMWTSAVQNEIEMNISKGFADHKIKVGGLSVKDDAARVAAAIRTINGDGRLALDANNAYKTVPEALHAITEFQKAAGDDPLWWFEEPLSPDNIQGHAELRRKSPVAIATGEIHQTRWDFADLLKSESADIIQVDVGVVGGITEWIRVAHAAETFNIQIAPHWHANAHAHLAGAIPGCIAVEHFLLEKDIYNFEKLLRPETRQKYENGNVILSDRPGLGFDLDMKKIEEFTI